VAERSFASLQATLNKEVLKIEEQLKNDIDVVIGRHSRA
jgi:hypothetical protein